VQKIEDPGTRQGFEIWLDEAVPVGDLKRGAYLQVRLTRFWPNDAIEVRSSERLLQDDWRHVAVSYDGSGKAGGMKLYLDGKLDEAKVLKDSLSGPVHTGRPFEVGNKLAGGAYKGRMDDLRIYSRELLPDEITNLAVHYPIRALLLYGPRKRSNEHAERLREYFLTYAAPDRLRRSYAEWKSLTKERDRLEQSIPTAMIMEELPSPRETHVLGRGDYRNLGDAVTAGVPAVLPPLAKAKPADRLALARWLVDPAHPLTARVAVNRYWQMCFGLGIVKTTEDFGSQGDPPSHPGLLDWLATEFMRTGWDIKAIERLIVTSATYRQSSRVTPELLERDPENRLLARGPRFRLPAEGTTPCMSAACWTGIWADRASFRGNRKVSGKRSRMATSTRRKPTLRARRRTSTGAACTASGSGRHLRHRWRCSTRRTGRSAPRDGRSPTRRSRRWL
jgi:hypothetical protein